MAGCKLARLTGIPSLPQQRNLLLAKDGMIPFSQDISAFDLARRVTTALSFALVLLAMATAARAQQPDDVITTNTSLVQLSVGVVDQQGRAITSLQSDDFVVYEDRVRRPILHFEPADTPFSLVLLLDMSGSTINFRQQIRAAAFRFLDALGPEDRVAGVQFNGKGVKSLFGFSTDPRRPAYAITYLSNC